jgi:hypothetical protein
MENGLQASSALTWTARPLRATEMGTGCDEVILQGTGQGDGWCSGEGA